MNIRIGTSGYSYKEWKGSFYPEDLPAKRMLNYYAQRFSTVEINNTFYRMPVRTTVESWAAEVPQDFTFVLKAPQRITHQKRLVEAEEDLSYFWQAAGGLGDRLGPVLMQLPPFQKKDVAKLRAFLSSVDQEMRVAFEFRHPSWEDDEVVDVLRSRGAALCVADTDESVVERAIVPTTDFGYLRLRRVEYSDDALKAWAERIREQSWREAFVFFKHEDEAKGPRFASRLMELLEGPSGPSPAV